MEIQPAQPRHLEMDAGIFRGPKLAECFRSYRELPQQFFDWGPGLGRSVLI